MRDGRRAMNRLSNLTLHQAGRPGTPLALEVESIGASDADRPGPRLASPQVS
jgi:hypothetical protein